MMNGPTYAPKAKNRSASVLVLVLVICAAVCILLSGALSAYRGLSQLVGLIFAVAAIFVAFKYLLTSYVYTVFSDGAETPPCLLVEQKQGHRSSLVCRVLLKNVLSVEPHTDGSYPSRCYVYVATMRGGTYQLLRVRENGSDFCIKLEADEEFCKALICTIASAKEAGN